MSPIALFALLGLRLVLGEQFLVLQKKNLRLSPNAATKNISATSPCQCKTFCQLVPWCTAMVYSTDANKLARPCLLASTVIEDISTHYDPFSTTLIRENAVQEARKSATNSNGYFETFQWTHFGDLGTQVSICSQEGGVPAIIDTQQKYDDFIGDVVLQAHGWAWLPVHKQNGVDVWMDGTSVLGTNVYDPLKLRDWVGNTGPPDKIYGMIKKSKTIVMTSSPYFGQDYPVLCMYSP